MTTPSRTPHTVKIKPATAQENSLSSDEIDEIARRVRAYPKLVIGAKRLLRALAAFLPTYEAETDLRALLRELGEIE